MSGETPAQHWIEQLRLEPHPEGGFFREVYRSKEWIPHAALPQRFSGSRAFSTSIYYLLQSGDFSAFHRIHSDETWHFYAGGPLEIVTLLDGGAVSTILGTNVGRGEHLQYTVPSGVWFGARPCVDTHYSLVGCTVSPGFDFADFEMGHSERLCREFPSALAVIEALTRT
jgi:predicted cupin superfamily sugar epimerase